MKTINIRYNTKNKDDKFPWRVFVNNVEKSASKITLIGKFQGKKTFENGAIKWNINCRGLIIWSSDKAIIIGF